MKDSVAAPGAPVAPLDTVPKLLLRNAAAACRPPGHAPQGLRHLADLDLGAAARRGSRACHRPAQARARARRHGGHHRRQPPAPLCHVRRRAEPRRHPRSRLPGLGRRRDGLRARARRGEVRRRRGPGAGRQGHLGRRSAAASCARSSTTSRAASRPTIRPTCIPSSTSSELGREEMRTNAGAEGWWLDEIAKGKGADVSVMLYTSGTTGRPKGVMLTHENIVVSAQNGNKFDGFTADDILLAYLPMAWVGDHIFSYGQAYAGGHVRVLPREPGDRGRGPARDRPDLFLRAAARVREPAHPDHGAHGGRGLAEEAHVPLFPGRGAALRRGHPQRQAGRRQGPAALSAGQPARLCAAQQPHGLLAHARRLYRRRGHRARAVPVLPLARHQPEAALRPDRGQRLHHAAARRRGLSRHRRQAGPGRRDQDRRQRRGAVQEPRRVPQVLQERRGDQRHQDAGRLGAHRRCRLLRPARAPQDHRSRQGRGPPQQRRAVRAEVPREPHQVLSRGARGGRLRPGPRLRHHADQHRPDLGRQLGRAQQRVLCQLPGAGRPPPGLRHDRQAGGRAEQGARRRAADGGLADPALPDPAQGARRRRRRAHPHAEGAPLLHRRSLRAADQGALRRLQDVPRRHRGDLRGRPQGRGRGRRAHRRHADLSRRAPPQPMREAAE